MKTLKKSIHKLLPLLLLNVGNAQEEATEQTVELDPLKITATAFDKSSYNLAQPWYVIAEEELNRILQTTLGETLGWKPGVTSSSFTGGASRPIIRGHGGNRVRILSNGLGTQDLSSTSPDHAVTIDPLIIDQVEILRGPATLLYGGAANGGAVNVIDGRIPKSLITEATGGVSAGYIGASEGKYASLKFDIPSGKYVFHFDATLRDSKDYSTPSFEPHAGEEHEEGEEEEGPVSFVDNSFMDFDDKAVGVTYFGDSSRFGILFNRVKTKYGALTEEHHHHEEEAGHEGEEEEVGRPFIDLNQDRLTLTASFELDTELIDSISGNYVFSDYYHGEWEDADELGTAFDLESQETRWEIAHKTIADFSGIIGFQINIEELTLPEVESSYAGNNITGVDTDKSALFIFEEKPLSDALIWELGARIESTSHDLTGTTDKSNRDFDAVSGSSSLIYDYSDDYKLAASFNYSERAPSGEELYSHGVHHATGTYIWGDDSLDIEKSTGWDLSLKKVAGSFTGELVFFTTNYDGYIFQAATGREVELHDGDVEAVEAGEEGLTERRYNGVDSSFQGFEANLSFPVFEDGESALFLRGMFDYVNAENDSTNENLPRIPPMRIGAALEYTYGSFLGTLELRHAFEQDDLASGETVTPSYTILNARVDYQVFNENKAWNAFVEARNLTDELAYNSSSYRKALAPLPGRSINFGLNYKF